MYDLTVTPEGEWKPLERGEQVYQFMVEYAKSGRAKCRKCAENVAKDEVRIGAPIKWRGGSYGFINSWMHVKCTRAEDPEELDVESEVYGYKFLKPKDKKAVAVELKKSTPPEHIEKINPDDPAFLKRGPLARAVQPAEVTQNLLPFQLEGFGWMVEQEGTEVKGGILADEMGMGKTIQTITMIVEQKNRLLAATGNGAKTKSKKSSKSKASTNHPHFPTLVVCPTSSMMQWRDEIEQHTEPGTLSTFVYYGAEKDVSAESLREYDVVLTTFPVIEAQYRKIVTMFKVECPYCSRSFLKRALIVHLKYFCGPDAELTEKLKKREKKKGQATKKAMATLKIGVKKKKGKKGASDDTDSDKDLDSSELEETPKKKRKTTAAKGTGKKTTSKKSGAKDGKVKKEKVKIKSEPIDDEEGAPAPVRVSPRQKKAVNYAITAGEDESDSDFEATPPSSQRSTRRSLVKPEPESDEEGGARTRRSKRPLPMTTKKVTAKRRKDSESDDEGSDDDTYEESSEESSEEEEEEEEEESSEEEAPARRRGKPKGPPTPGNIYQEIVGKEESDDSEDNFTPYPLPKPGQKRSRFAVTKKKGKDISSPEKAEEEAVDIDDIDFGEYSVLHNVKWHRIVLDEAHRIKARTTSTAQAIYALKGEYKWCLSGTPLQNRVGELYSLVRFIKMEPFSYYYCKTKDCDCRSLKWNFGPMSRFCADCGHPPMRHYSYFNSRIINPISRYGGIGDGRKAFITLKHEILDKILLRRTKVERANDVCLPPLNIEIRRNKLTKIETKFYKSLYKQSYETFEGFEKKGTLLHNYAHIFELLAKLRQAVDHPYLVSYKFGEEHHKGGDDENEPESVICGICQDGIIPSEAVVAHCRHSFHQVCMNQYLTEQGVAVDEEACDDIEEEDPSGKPKKKPAKKTKPPGKKGDELECPVCFQALTIDMRGSLPSAEFEKAQKQQAVKRSRKSILNKIDMSKFTSSTKVEMLAKDVQRMVKASDDNQSIIFSQYSGMLDIIEWRLQKVGIRVVKLLGSMPMNERRSVLDAYKRDKSIKALLLTLRAGGEGLNLQNANHVYCLDPWWNPSVEMQAIQRAHRIGQTSPVTAVRFVTDDTIEERMVELQQKKQLVFEGTIDGSAAAISRLNEDDLRFLFKN